jgi:hypothetical protein
MGNGVAKSRSFPISSQSAFSLVSSQFNSSLLEWTGGRVRCGLRKRSKQRPHMRTGVLRTGEGHLT